MDRSIINGRRGAFKKDRRRERMLNAASTKQNTCSLYRRRREMKTRTSAPFPPSPPRRDQHMVVHGYIGRKKRRFAGCHPEQRQSRGEGPYAGNAAFAASRGMYVPSAAQCPCRRSQTLSPGAPFSRAFCARNGDFSFWGFGFG